MLDLKSIAAIFNAVPTPCIVLLPDSPRFTVISVNQAYCTATNTTESELLNRGGFEAFPDNPDDAEATGATNLRLSFEKVIATKTAQKMTVQRYDIPIRGTSEFIVRYWSPENSPVLNEEGEIEFIIHSVTDVTDQVLAEDKEKKASHELIKNQEHYRSLFEHHPDAIYSFDLAGNFLSANQGSARLAECSVEELLTITFAPLIAPEDAERVYDHFLKAGTGAIRNYNTGFISTKGNRRVINVTNLPILINEKIIGVYGIARDITQDLAAAEKIKNNEKRFRALIQNSTEGIALVTVDGIVVERSLSARKVLGLAHDHAGEKWLQIIHSDDLLPAEKALRNVLNKPQDVQTLECRINRTDDSQKWVEFTFHNQLSNPAISAIVINSRDVTDKKTASQILQSSEERYRNLFHNNPLPMWIYDCETYYFLEVNQAAIERYGYSEKEFLKLKVTDIRPAEDIEILKAMRGTQTTYGTRYNGHWRHFKKNGDLLYVDITSQGIHHEGRKARLILANDITEKVIAEEAIRTNEEVRSLIMNSALDAIICMDKAGLVTLWNTQAEKLFGRSRDEMMGKDISDYIIPEKHRPRYRYALKNYLETGRGFLINSVVEVNGINQHQVEFPIELTMISIEQQGSEFFCAFIRDITERKHHITALELSEKRFKALVQEGSDLISVLDEKRQYKYLSPAYTTVLGINQEELLGDKALNRIHQEDSERVAKTSELLRTEKRVQYLPYRYMDGYGQYRWLESVATNLYDDPSVEGVLFNSKDITERINYIRAIEEQNIKLREIAWVQSHLVRAPLSRIMGLVNIITNYSDENIDTKELLRSIVTSAHELDAVIREIVDNTQP